MIETNLNFEVNAEEHELINYALTNLLESAEEVVGYGFVSPGDNERIDFLRKLREKSYTLWAERFVDCDSEETVH